jgi:hypothetical protein
VAVVIVGDGKAIAEQLAAAKIPFIRVGYSEPISARERAARDKAKAAQRVDADPGSTKALIDVALRAAGGEPALRKIKDVTVKFEMKLKMIGQEMPAAGTVRHVVPDKTCMEMSLAGMSTKTVITDQYAFTEMGPQRQDLAPELAKRQRRGSALLPALGLLQALDRKQNVIARKGVPDLGGRKVDALDLIDRDGETVTLYLDRQTHAVVLMETGGTKVAFADYRPVDGVQVPHSVRVEASGNRPSMEQTVTAVKFNQGIPLDVFKR